MRVTACVLLAAAVLAGCENTGLRNIQGRGDGPDEFIIVPAKTLERPDDLSLLPPPTPGGSNRTDQHPLEDSIAELGGRRSSPNAQIPARDGALVSYSSRYGRDASIRATLAEADAEFRRRQGRLTQIRIFREDVYVKAYRREALDPSAVVAQYRRAGIPTPSAPPARR